jgi:tRNA/rRNA methyltransferase/tRNA (cytidine32/uridine32-2'-O)-methyltransferase
MADLEPMNQMESMLGLEPGDVEDGENIWQNDYTQHPALKNLRIVLIETSHPGNIGAVARAMKNMGLSQLVLVNPKHFPSVEASTRASSAADILDRAKVVSSLGEALTGAKAVFGASARLRKVQWPQKSVRETAAMALPLADQGEQIALVFGRESSGLSNEEMDRCHYLSHIPTNPAYSSLNIAQAVQVFAYECLMASEVVSPSETQAGLGILEKNRSEQAVESKKAHKNGLMGADLASADQLEGFYGHLFQALQDIEFLDPAKNARFMRRMRRLFHRAQLDVKEVDILRGILTAAQRKARQAEKNQEREQGV